MGITPGERDRAEGMSGAGSGAAVEGEGGLCAGVGLAAAGLVAAGLELTEPTAGFPGLGAVGGPRGFGDTGGGTRFVSDHRKEQKGNLGIIFLDNKLILD